MVIRLLPSLSWRGSTEGGTRSALLTYGLDTGLNPLMSYWIPAHPTFGSPTRLAIHVPPMLTSMTLLNLPQTKPVLAKRLQSNTVLELWQVLLPKTQFQWPALLLTTRFSVSGIILQTFSQPNASFSTS
jgi:hypothetical protein